MENKIKKNMIKKDIKTIKKDIFKIIKEVEFINNYYKENIKDLDTNYLITPKDIKIFQFFFKYLFESLKFKDIHIFFIIKNKNIISRQNPDNLGISKNILEKIKYIIPKFINLCLLNYIELAKCLGLNDKYFYDNILKIAKILFLNDFINEKDLQMILFIQFILCLYNKNNKKNSNIQNEKQIYLVTEYLLTFCSNNNCQMSNEKIGKFNQIISYLLDKMDESLSLDNNYSNKYLLARNKFFYRTIYLTQITSITLSPDITSKIIKILVKIYAYKFNLDYIFEDLSDQFLYHTKKESLSCKTYLLMAKNKLLNDILEKEKQILKGEDGFIKNGFYFSDCPKNGIICDSVNKFPNENDGYSIVISFRLMNTTNKIDTNDNKVYTIFSLMNKDNNIFHFYIEGNKLKLRVKKEKSPKELYEISNNTNYVLWIIQSKLKKHKMILYLNKSKNIINSLPYPEGYYKINLGFSNCNNPDYISKDNFVGIIGTFIIFKKCLIKDENDNINITKLTELKANYEDIIYVNCKRDWGFIDKNINWILNKMENDINIYTDIDIIISTKSLGNLNLLYDKNNILGELKSEIYCNYFQNSSMKDEVKYYFRNKSTLKEHLNFPIQVHNTFIENLNSHIFLYLQLELYYFISLLSFKISEINESKQDNDKNKNIEIFTNINDKEDFYINLTKICSLFLFCIDSFNSITCLNSSQESMFQNEIDNFKYTLYDLISMYSKYGCKINNYFLAVFVDKITKKKYFEHSVFILTFEFYDINNNEVFNVLFNYLNHISIEECDNNQIKKIFSKLIDFDKIYLNDKIAKETKKEYSKIMRFLVKASIEEKLSECYNFYRRNLKKLKEDFEKKNMNYTNGQNLEEEDSNNYFYKNNIKSKSEEINENVIKFKNKSRKSSSYKKSFDSNDKNNELKNLDYLILIYKHLKNLYIGISNIKKKFIELCENRKNTICDFFNQLFSTLCEMYPIETDEQVLNYNDSEIKKKEITTAELIKCLCIRFLDDLFFEENIKTIKEEESKKQMSGDKNEENDSKKGSTGTSKNSFNSASIITRTNLKNSKIKKNSFKKDVSSNNLLSMLNPLNNSHQSSFISNFTNVEKVTIEGILTSKMEFFDKIILSQYTFKSLFLMLFRDIPNDKKLKIIKDDKNISKRFLMSEKHFPKTRYLLRIIILLFEKQNQSGYDTLFMSKIQLIEYCYDKFSDLLKNMLENYIDSDDEKKRKLKPIINSIFVDKGNSYDVFRFYDIMIENIACNFNFNGCFNNKQNFDIIKDCLDKLLIQIQNDIEDFMEDSLFELIDPFYFKLLTEIYFKNDKNNEYIIHFVVDMIERIITKMSKENKNRIIELNCKNILILLYKMIFLVKKRNLILYSENELFIKKVFLFLSQFMQHCNILYTKILFPIEESKSKLLIEILFEIIMELHLEYLRNPKIQSLQVSTNLLQSLFNEEKIMTNLSGIIKHKKTKNKNTDFEAYSPFYIMDKMSFITISINPSEILRISDDITVSKHYYELRDYILLYKYKDEYKDDKNLFSACILFCIKLILSIKELKEFYSLNKTSITSSTISHSSNSETNSDSKNKEKDNENTINLNDPNEDIFIKELKNQFINLTKNVLKIHIENTSSNPFKSIGYYAKNIYEYFRSFIVDKLSFSDGEVSLKVDELVESVSKYKSDLKVFARVIYTTDGRTKLYSEKTYIQIMKTVKSEMNKDNESTGSLNDKKSKHSSEERSSIKFGSLRGSFANNSELGIGITSVKSMTRVASYAGVKSQNQFNQSNNLNKSSNKIVQKHIYIKTIKFAKDLVRTYFSSYFKKLLTYDEDFINIKKLYILTYHKEIKDIDNYGIIYPTKLKSYIANNYSKIFLKRDFNFFTDGYFQYSHQFLYNEKYNYKYAIQNKLLFPSKKLVEENDSAHKDLSSIVNELVIYECEMITVKGSIFGNILVFENCLLFKSELVNDKRKKESNSKDDDDDSSYMDYACCTIDYDHLKKYKRIIIEYNNIKEVVNRTFFYTWISLEIFMKDGKSYFFNFFNEDTNKDITEYLKQKKIPVIDNIYKYYKKEEFAKKWKEEKITTYDYLLLLNKLTSRSYNDPNQYPVMPWLFLEEGINFIRNFDLPISVQDSDKQEMFLKSGTYIEDDVISHGNHYSTSAYIVFYLMRANPFTNNMIRFQSKNFDVPDRQYNDMKQTIFLCQKMNNNREMIPELFSIPEIYINLNDNDFGKQKDGTRVHNISFSPYCDNPIQFSYLLKDLMNNNPEVNNHINKWFDFIFGVNQLGNFSSNKKDNLDSKEKEKLKTLRKFGSNCYGQLFNMKKLISEAQKANKTNSELYEDIKTNINISVSFGQCPYQLLTEVHPSKNKTLYIDDNCSTMSSTMDNDSNINYRLNSAISNKSNKVGSNKNMILIKNNVAFKDIYKIKGSGEIIYFGKSSNNNYLYCLLDNRVFEIFKLDEVSKSKFDSIKSVKPKCQFLFLKKTKDGSLIFRPKFIFCEINENIFICCRTFDKTLKYYNYHDDYESQFVLKSYTTCILNINNNEFITGHDNGYLCKWTIDSSSKDKKPKLELLSLISSNKNSITCLTYSEKLSIIISSDINNMIIRKSHDFEYLVSIEIENKNNLTKSIVDVKISDYDLIYALIFIEETQSYELQGFTLNGTYFGKYCGNISEFQIAASGKIIVGDINKPILEVLDPVNFTQLYYKMFPIKGDNKYYQFIYDRPNVIYFGVKDNDSTRIKILFLDSDDEVNFM